MSTSTLSSLETIYSVNKPSARTLIYVNNTVDLEVITCSLEDLLEKHLGPMIFSVLQRKEDDLGPHGVLITSANDDWGISIINEFGMNIRKTLLGQEFDHCFSSWTDDDLITTLTEVQIEVQNKYLIDFNLPHVSPAECAKFDTWVSKHAKPKRKKRTARKGVKKPTAHLWIFEFTFPDPENDTEELELNEVWSLFTMARSESGKDIVEFVKTVSKLIKDNEGTEEEWLRPVIEVIGKDCNKTLTLSFSTRHQTEKQCYHFNVEDFSTTKKVQVTRSSTSIDAEPVLDEEKIAEDDNENPEPIQQEEVLNVRLQRNDCPKTGEHSLAAVREQPNNIPDAGKGRRNLDTGFQRDGDEKKARWSLFPPHVWMMYAKPDTEKFTSLIMEFLYTGEMVHLTEALVRFIECHNWDPMSDRYDNGGKKYGYFNWATGAPLTMFIDSLGRHLHSVNTDVVDDDDHIGAIMWNLSGAIHILHMVKREVFPEQYIDIPAFDDPRTFNERFNKGK